MNTTHSSPLPIQQLVDRQIKEWEIQKRTRRSDPGKTPIDHHEFVTISRTLGSGGNDIAHLLGQQIGWPVIDNEIIQVMARDDDTRERLYDSLDERDRGWVEDFLHTILLLIFYWYSIIDRSIANQ